MRDSFHHVVGLDLGQQADYTALALVAVPPVDRTQPLQRPVYQCRTLKRWPLGTAYTAIVAGLVKFLQTPAFQTFPPLLVIDETGVGRPVVEMVREGLTRARARFSLRAVTITGGHAVSLVGSGVWHVAKKQLVGVLQVLLQNRRLQVAPGLREAAALVKELQAFKVKITAAGNETFESWRERDHDDLVLAVALACWAAESVWRSNRPVSMPRVLIPGPASPE